MVKVSIREAYRADAQATRSCASAAFEVYNERIGKPPALRSPDFEMEIEDEFGGGLVQDETEKSSYIDTLTISKGGALEGC